MPVPQQTRGLTAIDGVMALLIVLLVVQIWLLSATLEAFLAGHRETALPAAIISGLIFLACLGLYIFVDRLDAETRGGGRSRVHSHPERSD
jgi:hypothetical protein